MERGDRREAIFKSDADPVLFLRTLSEACECTGWLVHACALMGNHDHLLIETPQPGMVAGMEWFQGTHSIQNRWNACQNRAKEVAMLNVYSIHRSSPGAPHLLCGRFAFVRL